MYQIEETDAAEVPEHVKHLYKEQDGKFVADASHHGVLETLRNLDKGIKEASKVKKTANEEAAAARTQLQQFRAVLNELDLDAEDMDQFKARFKDMADKIAKGDAGKINWDKLKADMEKAHKSALDEKDGLVQKMTKKLERHLIEKEAVSAIAAEKGVPDLLLPHIVRHCRVVEDGDDYVVQVVDKDGEPRGNAKGALMTIADLVKELKASPTYGRAFEAEGGGGSGAQGARHNPGVKKQVDTGNLSATDKIKAGLASRRR